MAKKTVSVPRQRELLSFGRRLKSWRKVRKLSQEKLALAAGLDYSYVNEIENGKINPGLMTLMILAQTLEIHPAILLMPIEQARKWLATPELRAEQLEYQLFHELASLELLDTHCQLLLAYARAGRFRMAQQWLDMLKHWHAANWRLLYTQARYLCLQIEPRSSGVQMRGYSLVAEPATPYLVKHSHQLLDEALLCLQQAFAHSTIEDQSRHLARLEPDLQILKQIVPAQWAELFQG